MFDGKAKSARQVNFAGKNARTDSKSAKDLVENARKQREARAQDRQRNQSVTKVQAMVRSKLARKRLHASLRSAFDQNLGEIHGASDTGKLNTVLQALPQFFDLGIGTDVGRLASVSSLLHSVVLSTDVAVLSALRVDLSCICNTDGRNILRSISRTMELAIDAVIHQPCSRSIAALVARVVELAQSSVVENHWVGIVLSLYLARSASNALRRTANTAVDMRTSELCTVLRSILVQALSFTDNAGAVAAVAPAVWTELLKLRQAAVRAVAANLLTQPSAHNGGEGQWATFITPEDWLSILLHWHSSTPTRTATTSATLSGVSVSIAKAVAVQRNDRDRDAELLNLLAFFATTFVNTSQHIQLLFSTSSAQPVDPVSQLGALFVNLAARLLGAAVVDADTLEQNRADAQQQAASAAAVVTMFGVSNSLAPSINTTATTTSAADAGGLPVHWLVQQLTSGSGRTSPALAVTEDAMDVVPGSPHPASMGTAAAVASTAAVDAPEDVYAEYLTASGWKKLEYRITGVRKGLALQQERAARSNGGGGGVGTVQVGSVNASAHALERLVAVLAQRGVVAALTNQISQEAGTWAVQDVEGSAHSGAGDRSTSTTAEAVIALYAQLLLAYPSEVSSSGKVNTTVLSADQKVSLLISLAFANPTAPLAKRLWQYIVHRYGALLDAVVNIDDATLLHTKVFLDFAGGAAPAQVYQSLLSVLYLFCAVFLQQLAAIDDETLLEQQKIFTVPELRAITIFLKRWLFKLYWSDPLFDIGSSFYAPPVSECTPERLLKLHCQLSATRLFNHLCGRNERRGFLQAEDWGWAHLSGFDLGIRDEGVGAGGVESYGSTLMLKNAKVKSVLTFIPQVVPFKQRVAILHSHLDYDKAQYYSQMQERSHEAMLGLTGALRIEVRRDSLVADAYDQLHAAGHRLKGMVKVEFISEQGYNEAGIDGGGLFKEFIDSFAKEAFSPTYGLFLPTSHQLLTPNPSSGAMGSNHLRYFNSVGKILGKSLYEHILLESEFAGGFLNFLLDRKNSVDDLFHLDEQLYRSLMHLKHYANQGGDIESLELYFDTSRSEYGKVVTQELMPGGSSVRVTKSNVHAYIHQLANHKLNVEGAEQCRALRAGLQTMVPLEWIRMFSTRELQLLISGDRRSIDVADMRAHVNYGSGYHASQPYIQAFWDLVASMSAEDQGHLLRFVTSCSRQPLLGFSQLQPAFCIQKIPAYASQYSGLEPPQPGEVPRLPSAATCMNLLKLPTYDSVEMLRDRLLYAIRSNSGFELS